MLVNIEGIDGSGKGTITKMMLGRLIAAGKKVSMLSFPDYKGTVYGRLVGRYLNGDFGESVHPALRSLLYAMDRREHLPLLKEEMSTGIVLCDRYVSSNLAYACLSCPAGELKDVLNLIAYTEYGLLGLPVPDVILILDMPVEFASQNVAKKAEREYTARPADLHEAQTAMMRTIRNFYVNELSLYHPTTETHVIGCVENDEMLSLQAVCDKAMCFLG